MTNQDLEQRSNYQGFTPQEQSVEVRNSSSDFLESRLSTMNSELAQIDEEIAELVKPIQRDDNNISMLEKPNQNNESYLYDMVRYMGEKIVEGAKFIPGVFYLSTFIRKKYSEKPESDLYQEHQDSGGIETPGQYILFNSVVGSLATFIPLLFATPLIRATMDTPNFSYSSMTLPLIFSGVAANAFSGVYEYVRHQRLEESRQKLYVEMSDWERGW